MSIARIRALFKREITDIFRDKKTLIMMVIVPIFLYPLIIIFMSLIMSAMTSGQAEKSYYIAFVDDANDIALDLHEIFERESEDIGYQVRLYESENSQQDLEEQRIDAFVTVDRKGDEDSYRIHYLSAKSNSSTAARALVKAFEYYRDDVREARITQAGLDVQTVLYPIEFETTDYSSGEETMGSIMGSVLPMLMIMSIMLGAIYPAIDVTAGERERGTLETLLTLPVTNFEMIMSKFLAVSLIACTSAVLNIASMGVALGFMSSMLAGEMGNMELQLSSFIPAVLFTVVVMLFFALFVTAVCLCVCLFAKSFKEANNYITPVMLVFMFSGYAGMIPNVELNVTTAAIPVVNITLMITKLFQFQYDYPLFGIVLVSNAAYSLIMVWLLGKIYNSESVLFGEGLSSVKLFTKRSEMKKGQMPGYGDVVLLVCGVFLLLFYVGMAGQVKLGFGGVVINQAIIMVVPVVYAWYLRADWKRLFSLQTPKIRHWAGAAVLWLGGFSGLMVLSSLLTRLMPDSAHAVESAFGIVVGQPFIVLVLVIAVMPAIGEELMFRGFVFGTLKEKVRPMSAMLITSAIFGIYHMSLIKFFTTALLGFVIVLAVQRTGNIFVGMLMHFLNNFISVVSMKYPERLQRIPVLGETELTAANGLIMLAVCAAGIMAGMVIMGKEARNVEGKDR